MIIPLPWTFFLQLHPSDLLWFFLDGSNQNAVHLLYHHPRLLLPHQQNRRQRIYARWLQSTKLENQPNPDLPPERTRGMEVDLKTRIRKRRRKKNHQNRQHPQHQHQHQRQLQHRLIESLLSTGRSLIWGGMNWRDGRWVSKRERLGGVSLFYFDSVEFDVDTWG